jgi:hypothetical protein
MVLLTVLAAVSVYRFTHVQGADEAQRSAATRSSPPAAPAPKHTPLVSTSAK